MIYHLIARPNLPIKSNQPTKLTPFHKHVIRKKPKLIIQNGLFKKLIEFYTQLNLTNQEEEKTQWKTIQKKSDDWIEFYKLQWLHKLLKKNYI